MVLVCAHNSFFWSSLHSLSFPPHNTECFPRRESEIGKDTMLIACSVMPPLTPPSDPHAPIALQVFSASQSLATVNFQPRHNFNFHHLTDFYLILRILLEADITQRQVSTRKALQTSLYLSPNPCWEVWGTVAQPPQVPFEALVLQKECTF